MQTRRQLLLLILVAIEVVVLLAIISVLRSTLAGDWRLTGDFGWGVGSVKVQREEFIPLEALTRAIRVTNDMGSVTVIGSADSHGIRVTRHAVGRSQQEAEERLETPELTVTTTDNVTVLEARSGSDWVSSRPYIDLEIMVPREMVAEINAAMGRVTVRDFDGRAGIKANMGSVLVTRFSGDLTVDANMGRVELTDILIRENLDVEANMGSVAFAGRLGKSNRVRANMGSVRLTLAADHPAVELEASWSMGSFRYSQPLSGEVTNRSAHGVLGGGTPAGRLTLRSDMGSMRIDTSSM